MQKFVRPALCRLCECPAGSDGVRLSDVDIEKLSRWWREALQTEWDEEDLDEIKFCQFCLWDAKFQGERTGSDGTDWWTGHDTNQFYKEFYRSGKAGIRPCEVRISKLQQKVRSRDRETSNKHPTVCVHCRRTFESIYATFRHAFEAHRDTDLIQCSMCYVHFETENAKTQHMRRRHPKRIPTQCHYCRSAFDFKLLWAHICKAHPESKSKCCGRKFLKPDALLSHMASNQIVDVLECVYCKRTYPKKTLLVHIPEKHGDVSIKCVYRKCSKYFLSEAEKQRHVSEAHENKPRMLQCVYCACKFSHVDLATHVMQVHNMAAIKCDHNSLCLSYFHSQRERTEHVRKEHLSSKVLTGPKCLRCDVQFQFRRLLLEHMSTKHDLEVVICKSSACYEYFRSDSELRQHFQERHAEEEERKKFRCPECTFRTDQLIRLQRHSMNNHGTKRFECPRCPAVCKSNSTLKLHVFRTHGERRTCPHCKVAFKRLQQHLLVVPCRQCKSVPACRGLSKAHTKSCQK